MATRQECDEAVARLASALQGLDPEVRRRAIPPRDVSLVVTDLDLAYTARLDGDGVHDWAEAGWDHARGAQIRFSARSDELVRISRQPGAFLSAWTHGRVGVHARLRDLLALRRLL